MGRAGLEGRRKKRWRSGFGPTPHDFKVCEEEEIHSIPFPESSDTMTIGNLRLYDCCFNDVSKCSSPRHLIAWPKIRKSPTIEHEKKVAVLYRRQPMGDHDNCYMIT
jgi:hypothetical protein